MNKNNFYLSLYKKIEGIQSHRLETISYVLYILTTIFVAFFHEPWFDEFQAWGISKASLYSIFFQIPHFEGHPPLWHLVLKCFTSFNIHPELAIKIPNLLFMYIAVWLVVFKSPFSRLIRLILPFTFFIFYQYTIVSRPYSMFTLALILIALFYKTKNTNPYRFLCSLVFLCLTSLYGMVITTLLCLIWVYELCIQQSFKNFIKDFVKDRRFYGMLILFFLCCFLSYICFPDNKVALSSILATSPTTLKIFYSIFGIFSDFTFLRIVDFNRQGLLSHPLYFLIIAYLIGAYIHYLFINELRKKQVLRFLVILYALLFFSYNYMFPYHLGILFVLSIVIFWISIENSPNYKKFGKQFLIIVGITLAVQFAWGINSAIMDVFYDYAPSRSIANYIKKYSLHKYKLGACWILSERYENTNHQSVPVLVNPYFGKNIFITFNAHNPKQLFVLHQRPTSEEVAFQKSFWTEPDIFFGIISKSKQIPENYVLMNVFSGNYFWKSKPSMYYMGVYIKKDFLNKIIITDKK